MISFHNDANDALELFGNKQVDFRFRSVDLSFTLSHGLFSSADIDSGTRFLLKVLSKGWDEDKAKNFSLPLSILDAGCGAGIIGVTLAAVLLREQKKVFVRCQDRDELAIVFTEANARRNTISAEFLNAYAEPLLTCPLETFYDLIISNIPAKTGMPVLQDFVSRSAKLLSAQGKVFVVIVNPLAEIFRAWIVEARLDLLHEESGKDHTVFAYKRGNNFSVEHERRSFNMTSAASPYLRHEEQCELEGQSFFMRTFYGAADFDHPGILVQHTIKLISKLNLKKIFKSASIKILAHECGQGHLSVWLGNYFENILHGNIILSGRNILALKASQYNCGQNNLQSEIFPAVDFGFNKSEIENLFGKDNTSRLIIAFPESIPTVDRFGAIWEGLSELLNPNDIAIMGFTASEADRFDKIKPKGFTRMNDIKRNGFRVMAYRRSNI